MKTPQKLLLFILPFVTTAANGQGIIDGFYTPEGEVSLTASYTYSTYDEFYVGETEMSPVPAHNEITQSIYSLYGKYGLFDDLTLILNVPFITAQGDGVPDPFNGETEVSGIQDVQLAAKYRPFRIDVGGGTLDGITAVGIGVPGGYEPNGILSLGSGAFTTNLQAGGHLQLDAGIFITAVAGYSLRGEAPNNNDTLPPGDFDVPNAFTALGKVGYSNQYFFVEAWLDYQATDPDAPDIMGPGFMEDFFPGTRVNYTRVGVSAYVPVSEVIGLSAGVGTVASGRNVGKPTFFNGGVTFNFGGS